MEQRKRKLMTMHKVLHSIDDIDRLDVSRKERGKELANITYCVDVSTLELKNYLKKSNERLITAANCSSKNISIDWKATKN